MTQAIIGIIRTTTNWLKNEAVSVDSKAGLLGRPDTLEKTTLYKMYFALCEIANNADKLSKLVLNELNEEQGQ